MCKVALKVAYIGTNFYGFQRQPKKRTVEEELLNAFKKSDVLIDPQKSEYSIAGRTDRGVHALGNVVSFTPDSDVIINRINDYLSKEIRIIGKTDVDNDFNPRFATNRFYRYVLVDDPLNDRDIDLDKMIEASQIFIGTHNFHNFSKKNQRIPIRTVRDVKVLEKNDLIFVDVVGESFLWNMVRKMVRVLLNVGIGEMEPGDVEEFLDPSLQAAILPMPPDGLILMDVKYDGVKFEHNRYAENRFMKTLKKEYLQKKTLASVYTELMKTLKG